MIMGFSFEFDMDLEVVERIHYTILDMLSDLGGIEALLFSTFGIILGFWNHNNFDNHLLS